MTIKEIAKLSGVGTSTVSRYLNGGYVSREAKIKIAKVIDETGYTPNRVAKELKQGSKTLSILIPRITSYTASKFVGGILAECEKRGIDGVIKQTNFNEKEQERLIKEAISNKELGIIIYAFNENEIRYNSENLLFIGQKTKYHPYLYISGRNAYKELIMETLVQRPQIKTITYIGSSNKDDSEMQGRREAVKKSTPTNLSYKFIQSDFEGSVKVSVERDGFYLCMSDKIAYSVYKEGERAGLKVGSDYFLAGFGDYEYSQILGITSIGIDYELLGRKAVCELLKVEEEQKEVKTYITYRSST